TAAAVTLALAIAANTTIFSAVQAVLLAPTPIHEPDDVVVAWQTEDSNPQAVVELTYRHLQEWNEVGGVFTSASLMGSHNWTSSSSATANQPASGCRGSRRDSSRRWASS